MPLFEQLANWRLASSLVLGAYILGCCTAGYYLVRVRTGRDIRELASGSVGARNVGRVLGWTGFCATLAGDFAKGAFAVWAARHFTTDDRLVTLSMLAVVGGHIWPVQLQFRGGKGVATSLGALLLYDWRQAVAFVIFFACGFLLLRRTVLPALFAFACLPLVAAYWEQSEVPRAVGISILAGLILVAHRKNLIEEISLFVEHRNIDPERNQPEL